MRWVLLGLAVWATGSPAAGGAESVVPLGAVWAYDDRGQDLGASWREPGFDDSGWESGAAYLGYGEAYIVTHVDDGGDPDNRHITTYFRHTFAVDEAATLRRMALGIHADDGLVVYLNGVEIHRQNLPLGAVTSDIVAEEHAEGRAHPIVDVSSFVDELIDGTNLIAVELHQASASSSDLVFDAELRVATTDALVVRGPVLQRVAPNEVTVRWRTDRPVEGWLAVGTTRDVWTHVGSSPLDIDHEVRVTGLAPGTSYAYAVGRSGETLENGPELSFRTQRLPHGDPVSIWITGDSGSAGIEARQVRDAFLDFHPTDQPDLWLSLGDLAYSDGLDDEFTAGFYNTFRELARGVSVSTVRGNHDDLYEDQLDYYDHFAMPTNGEQGGVPSGTEAYYSVDVGNAHVILLDSQDSAMSPGSPMHDWMIADLEAAGDAEWVIVALHHPPYTKGTHNSDNESDSAGRLHAVREHLLPTLESYGVDLVVAGHSHGYERTKLITGHYGESDTFDPATMVIDGGDGSPSGTGAYEKPTSTPGPHQGTVYVVVGNFSKSGGGTYDHPTMVRHDQGYGSMVVDIDGHELTARYLNRFGLVLDGFVIRKPPSVVSVPSEPVAPAILSVSSAGRGHAIRFSHPGAVRITVYDVVGRRVHVTNDAGAGERVVVWDGRVRGGRSATSGVYFVEVRGDERSATTRLHRVR